MKHRKQLTVLLFASIVSMHGLTQTDRLLWYTGKKLSDTSLQTASGLLVSYSPSSGRLRVTRQGDNMISSIISRLGKREEFQQRVIRILTQGPGGNRNIDLANRAASIIAEVDGRVEELTAGGTDWEMGEVRSDTSVYLRTTPPWVQQYFDEVVNYVIQVKSRQEPELPAPPRLSFDYCYFCDTERQQRYSKDTAAYFRQMFQDHSLIIPKALKVIRFFEDRRARRLPHDSVAASRMVPKMESDMRYLLAELAERVVRSWNRYKNDAERLPLMTDMILAISRQFELLGGSLPGGFPGAFELNAQIIATINLYFDRAANERNYPVLLNIAWIIQLLRQSALLNDESPVAEQLTRFLETNRFELAVEAEGKMGKGGQNMLAKMTGSNYYRAIPDKDCKLRWYLYSPEQDHMKFTLEKAEMNMGAPASYTGTTDWRTPPARIELGFCEDPVRDSLMMESFAPVGEESWTIAGRTTPGMFVRSIFMSCFMDEKRVRAAAADKQLEQKLKKELMEQHANGVAGNESLLQKDPATMTATERERLAALVSASQTIQDQMVVSATAFNLLWKKRLDNNLKTVFEDELDGKQLFPRNTAIQNARFRIKIIHLE